MTDSHGWWALDLLVVVFLADLAAAAIYLGLPGVVRIPLALVLVLLLPGYALTAVFFPATNRHAVEIAGLEDRNGGLLNPLPVGYEIDGVERLVLSVALSIAIVPAVAAVANFTPRGVTLEPVLAGVVVVTVALAIVAFLRRLRLEPAARFRVSGSAVGGLVRPFERQSPLYGDARRLGSYNLAAGVGLVIVLASVGFALAAPPAGDTFTEFYVVTEDATGSTATPYPSTFSTGEARPVTLGIENHEGEDQDYTVVVLVRDGDGGSGAGAEELGSRAVTVPDGESRELTVEVQPTRAGEDRRLVLLLYRGEPPADPTGESAYRTLDLAVDVTGGVSASQAP